MKSHLFIFVSLMFSVLSLFSQIPGWASLPGVAADDGHIEVNPPGTQIQF